MMLTFDRGDASRPKGHALLYFTAWADPSAIFATYLVVPPISVEISKYIPPMFAAQFQQMGGAGGIAVFPYPPIPERVESYAFLERLAKARDEDLVSGGSVDASSPERLLQASAEAAQQYYANFSAYLASFAPEPEEEPALDEASSVQISEVLYGLMSEGDRLRELAKLSGQLRYAVGGGDTMLIEDTTSEMKRLARYLPEKYRVEETIQAASTRGPEGDRLTQLYLDRAFKLINEDYEGLQEIESEIRRLAGKE